MIRPIEGFVLTGGASTRMGRDKATLNFGTETLARRAVSVLSGFAKSVRVVGGCIEGIEGVPDVVQAGDIETRASIIGLHSALVHGRSEWIAILACDLPFVTAELFRRLADIVEAESDAPEAVVPAQTNGKLQPLAALYRRGACRRETEKMLDENNYRLTELLNRVSTLIVPPEGCADLDHAEELFLNINTPGDLEAALEKLERRESRIPFSADPAEGA